MTRELQSPLERATWLIAAAIAALLLHSLYRFPIGFTANAIVVATMALAALAPAAALTAVAGLGPLAGLFFLLIRTDYDVVRFEEVFVLAFLIGWSLRRAFTATRARVSPAFRWSAALLVAAALASGIVTAYGAAAESPGTTAWASMWSLITHDYLIGPTALLASMLMIEGILLAAVAAETCAANPGLRRTVIRLMVASAAAAGLLHVSRIAFAAMAREEPWAALATLLASARVSVLVPDLNAAGSYFAMMLVVAAGASRSPAAAGCAGLIAAGLWITGSRTALAACVLVGISVLAADAWRQGRRKSLAAGTALLVLAAAAAVVLYPQDRNEATRPAFLFRVAMNKVAVSMTSDYPAFGAGLGRFFALSENYMPAEYAGTRENAHNNFLQVSAELGVLGFGAFALLLVSGFRAAWRSRGTSAWERALLPGLVAFLLTCLAGHPLLVAGAAFPFWLLLGTGVGGGEGGPGLSRRSRLIASAVLVLIIGSIPFRAAAAASAADLEHVGIGMSLWQRDGDGTRYRWAGGQSSLFVPADASAVGIPLRHGGADSRVLEVEIVLEGREADRILLEPGADWRTLRLILPATGQRRFLRVDLIARPDGHLAPLDVQPTDGSGAVMVGRLLVETAGR